MSRNPEIEGVVHLPVESFGRRMGMPGGVAPSVLGVVQVDNVDIIRHIFRLESSASGATKATTDVHFRAFRLNCARAVLGEEAVEHDSKELGEYYDEFYSNRFCGMSREEMEAYATNLVRRVGL